MGRPRGGAHAQRQAHEDLRDAGLLRTVLAPGVARDLSTSAAHARSGSGWHRDPRDGAAFLEKVHDAPVGEDGLPEPARPLERAARAAVRRVDAGAGR
jgi:hypothetical protein